MTSHFTGRVTKTRGDSDRGAIDRGGAIDLDPIIKEELLVATQRLKYVQAYLYTAATAYLQSKPRSLRSLQTFSAKASWIAEITLFYCVCLVYVFARMIVCLTNSY